MTREQQIENAINEKWSIIKNDYPHEAFCEGAEWADTHPNWHKYPEDRPKVSDEYIVAAVRGEKKWVDTYYFDTSYNCWGKIDLHLNEKTFTPHCQINITHWIPFPNYPAY